MKGVLIKIIVVFILLYVSAMWMIALDWMRETKTGLNKIAKFAIVYWSKVELNWEVSKRLQARLDIAKQLLDSQKVLQIIVSGWYGLSGYNEWEVMAQYLLNRWVLENQIIIDKIWDTTIETSKNAFEINKKAGFYPNSWVIWVSQFFHLTRVHLALRKAWFVNIWSVSPQFRELRDIYSLAREVPAYLKYFFWWIDTTWLDINWDDLKIIGKKVINSVKE